ncbi:SAF domain-containing protein [Nocardiopsis sp. FR6]|uniref:SAF domain-containing protein n=1 Tax=Nocardiopsis sp. FR6 TaxID=2605986 RepID=UPI001F48C0E4|nr:SAF domain-containing protein [Nocardiopsis sp. FR6]
MVALANPSKTDQKTKEMPAGATGEWESVRLAAASRRRWKWGLLAGVLIAAGGGAGSWAGLASEETRPVAVLNADLPAGHVISAEDVSLVDMAETEGIHLLSPETVTGMVLARPVPAGSPLVAASVADSSLWPEQGQAVLAVPVSTIPQDLEEGATVDLITPDAVPGEEAEGDGPEDTDPTGSSDVVTGLVHRIVTDDGDGFGSGQKVLEVVLPRHHAAHLSRAVAGGQAQVTIINPREVAQSSSEKEHSE